MASNIEYPSDVNIRVNGTLSCRVLRAPTGSIGDEHIEAAANIAASKLIHQHAVSYPQAGGTDVVSASVPVHVFRNTAEIVSVQVCPVVAPTGGDKEYSVDVMLGNEIDAYASILSAPVEVDATVSNREVLVGSIVSAAATGDDSLQVVVTASGSTGSQGQGLIVTIWVREEP